MDNKSNFSFPVSPLVGSRFGNYLKIVSGKKTDPKYFSRFLLTTIASAVLDPFGRGESFIKAKTIKQTTINKSPVFIIGFWRSGTTFLHNLLCQDPRHAYVSTYQSIFPHHCLVNSVWVKKLAEIIAPEKRPVDHVKLDMSYPQEEEVALGNMQSLSFYNFFYFPDQFESYKSKALLFEEVSKKAVQSWEDAYLLSMKKAMILTGGERFISKNPPNTFRIPQLLKLFPDAKFIYIYRNPINVLSSYILFMYEVITGVGFQKIDKLVFEKQSFSLFKDMLEKYESDKNKIPAENLVEVKYEEFKLKPVDTIKEIYEKFNMSGFDTMEEKLIQYTSSQKSQKSGGHFIPEHLTEFIRTELKDYMEEKGYS
jgi:hypothetical protein